LRATPLRLGLDLFAAALLVIGMLANDGNFAFMAAGILLILESYRLATSNP